MATEGIAQVLYALSPVAATVTVIAALLIWIRTARDLGMHANLSGTMDHFHVDAIAIAITDLYYGGSRDYVGLLAVRDILHRHGLIDRSGSAQSDGAAIDRALDEASRLDWNAALSSARFIVGLEPGFADLVRLGFRLFGLRIAAISYTIWMMLGLSCAMFTVAFWHHPGLLWALGGLLAALHITIFGTEVIDGATPSVASKRILGIFAIVPAFHLMMALAIGQDASATQVILAGGQAFLFAFLLWIRTSVAWIVVALCLLVLFLCAGRLAGATDIALSLQAWVGQGLWVVPLWMGVSELVQVYFRRRIHPCYYSDDFLPAYPKWHPAYVGLAEDAETFHRARMMNQEDKVVDENACKAAIHYLGASPAFANIRKKQRGIRLRPPHISFNISAFANIKWSLYEEAVRMAFMDYVKANLRTMPRLYLVLKPLAILRSMKTVLQPLPAYLRARPRILPFLLFLGVVTTSSLVQDPAALLALSLTTGVLLVVSPLPQIWAFSFHPPGFSVAEPVWLTLFTVWTMASGVLALLLSVVG
ncbi:MAG: hypothetical protein H7840_12845 [Alphaproteobacteria bacterium]